MQAHGSDEAPTLDFNCPFCESSLRKGFVQMDIQRSWFDFFNINNYFERALLYWSETRNAFSNRERIPLHEYTRAYKCSKCNSVLINVNQD